jgi:hypothetical protein
MMLANLKMISMRRQMSNGDLVDLGDLPLRAMNAEMS